MGSAGELRSLQEIQEEMSWQQGGLGAPDPERSCRDRAVAHVLCQMPESDYWQLAGLSRDFWFQLFVPKDPAFGKLEAFDFHREGLYGTGERPRVRVLYLSPTLESLPWSIVVAVVAHELAHVVLRHEVPLPCAERDQKEREAWSLAETWGYKEEVRKTRAAYDRRAGGQ
jgi:hypothetical protein